MNFRSSAAAAGLLAALVTGCATAPASSPGPGTHTTGSASPAAGQTQSPSVVTATQAARSGCQRLAGGTLTLGNNGRTYCLRVGQRLSVYLRGTVASRWLVPRVSGNALVGAPNGALSLIAGVTGASFRAARPGRVLITSVRPPCQVAIPAKNEAEPASSVPATYPLRSCAPSRRFGVVIVVTR
ncbi:MAG TPA: hypothetical protein VKU77_37780 [Streptosporangiaceae bacterium]|nr:hypothetical protein [Streptosporangiaceae bacterium]